MSKMEKKMFALYYEAGKVNNEPATAVFEYAPLSEQGWQFAERWTLLYEAGLHETPEAGRAAWAAIHRATGKRHRYVVPQRAIGSPIN